jgi:hypothetical protein
MTATSRGLISAHDLMHHQPKVFTSESDEVLSPLDLRPGYIIQMNGRDYVFDGLNYEVIFVRRYRDPDLVGPHPRAHRMAYFWYSVESLHVY